MVGVRTRLLTIVLATTLTSLSANAAPRHQGERIDIELQDTNIHEVLRIFAEIGRVKHENWTEPERLFIQCKHAGGYIESGIPTAEHCQAGWLTDNVWA